MEPLQVILTDHFTNIKHSINKLLDNGFHEVAATGRTLSMCSQIAEFLS